MSLLVALAVSNLVSGSVTPLVLYDAAGVEYERRVVPGVGVSVSAAGGWMRLDPIEATHASAAAHLVISLPDPFEARPPAPPAGPLLGLGVTATRWDGRYHESGFHSRLSGSAVEPNAWLGYRLVIGSFFLEPRAGAGWAFGGAHYETASGRRVAYHGFATIGPFTPHGSLIVGLAW